MDATRYPASLLAQWRADADKSSQNAVGRPEHHAGDANTGRAKQALTRAGRLPRALTALIEDILALPNATIENTYQGPENERGRVELRRKHSQAVRELRSDAEDALPVLGNPPQVVDLLPKLFDLEAEVRRQIESARVPQEQQITATPQWLELQRIAGQIRGFST